MTASARARWTSAAQVALATCVLTLASAGLAGRSPEPGSWQLGDGGAPSVDPGNGAFAAAPLARSQDPPVAIAPDVRRTFSRPAQPAAEAAEAADVHGHVVPKGAVIVAPGGSKNGDGSIERPLDLATALATTGPVKPGGRILLRGGLYTGTYFSRLSGTPTAPVVVRSYPNEWAVFDTKTTPKPALTITGSDVWFRDFEVTKSDPQRISSQSGAAPLDISRGGDGAYSGGNGILVGGPRTKLINLVIHDAGNGIVTLRKATDSEIYGCIIYNNGWLGSDHAWGHGIYVQNSIGTKRIENNVVFNNFGWGVHAYDKYRDLKRVTVDQVTSFGNGAPAGAYLPNVVGGASRGPAEVITVRNSVLYHRPGAAGLNLALGFAGSGATNRSVTVEGNTLVGGSRGLVLRGWESAHVTGNTIAVAPIGDGVRSGLVEVIPANDVVGMNYVWNNNTYRDANAAESGSARSFRVGAVNQRALDFDEWRSETSFDTSTTYLRSAPRKTVVAVRPNRYASGRAFVTVLNWAKTPTVSIDLSETRLPLGARFAIYDVQDIGGGPLVVGTHRGTSVSLPMVSDAVTSPVGNEPAIVRHTGRDFGSFLVVPVAS